jgi:ribose 5-phosphate isomerase B
MVDFLVFEEYKMDHLKVAIGSDHGGFRYKESIIDYLKTRNIDYIDVGTYTPESCDYPAIARKVAEKVTSSEADRGILVCGTGIGM